MGQMEAPSGRKPFSTLQEAWDQYASIVCPENLPHELESARMAFFSGAVALEGAMTRFSNEGMVTGKVDEALEKVDVLFREVDSFKREVHAQAAIINTVQRASEVFRGEGDPA